MKILHTLSRTLGLTPNEGRIVLFLAAGLIAGGAMTLYLDRYPNPEFDHRAQDSVFYARTANGAPEVQLTASDDGPDPAEDSSSVAAADRVNINTAERDQLVTLPSVGEKTADLILAYRHEHGRFKSGADLMNIRGIGKKKLERLAPYISW